LSYYYSSWPGGYLFHSCSLQSLDRSKLQSMLIKGNCDDILTVILLTISAFDKELILKESNE